MSNKWNIPLALNTIYYGPPGTGKTHTLLIECAGKFFTSRQERTPAPIVPVTSPTSSTTNLVREPNQNLILQFVGRLTWWEACAVAMLDVNGPIRLGQLMDHQLLRKKSNLTNGLTPRNTVQNVVQSHTKEECTDIKTTRQSPLIFSHNFDSTWEIDRAICKQQVPHLLTLLGEYNEIKTKQTAIDQSKQQVQTTNQLNEQEHLHSQDIQQPIKIKPLQEEQGITRYEFVTFHQSYSYENFVEGISAKTDEETHQIFYSIESGIFKRFCNLARMNPDEPYALFIDEINRGNVSSIFGELIALIEDNKREGAEEEMRVKLPYSGEDFTVPPNLFIIGAMNTADRSIDALDSALRRRFSFIEMPSKPELLAQDKFKPNHLDIDLEKLLRSLNDRVAFLLDCDHRIGHSYFMKTKDASRERELSNLRSVFKNQIIPLLEDYFYGDLNKVALVLGEKFFTKTTLDSSCLLATDDDTSALPEKTIRNLVDISTLTEDDFKSLIR